MGGRKFGIGMGVCKRTVVRFLFKFAPRSRRVVRERSLPGRLPGGGSLLGAQTCWEAAKKYSDSVSD